MTELNQIPACSKPLLSPVRVFNGDCLEIMKNISDGSIDMILCDLPYGTTACKWDVILPFDKLWEQYERIIKPNGAIVLTGKEPFSSQLRLSNIKNYKYDIIWRKDRLTNIFTVKYRVGDIHENISIFYKKQPTYNPQKTEGWIAKNRPNCKTKVKLSKGNITETMGVKYTPANMYSEMINPVSIIEFTRERSHKIKRLHPTQKPVALFEYLIKTYTNENDLVLDNCAGSGTTGIACINTNRNCILIEKEEKYFDIINERIAKHIQQLAGEFSFENES